MAGVKRVAIVQSCYIPWKGYFDMVNLVDEFVLFDDRQFTRRDWRNRNRIKTAQGTQWLTIPVAVKGRYEQRIDETVIDDPGWSGRHLRTLEHAYAKTPCYELYRDRVAAIYESVSDVRLSIVNRTLLEGICDLLGIETAFRWSSDYEASGAKTDRLVSLCLAAGADAYLSGPAARTYIDEQQFAAAGIQLDYMDYDGYPEYPQLHGPFEHTVTILDLLFQTGTEAPAYMKSFSRGGIS